MPACDPTTLSDTRAGDLLQRNVDRINEWNALGYTVVDRDQFRFVVESIEPSATQDQATVVVCVADGSKLVLPDSAGGISVIVDDTFVSGREAWDMRLDSDGVWRAYAAPGVGETSEADQCGAA